MLRELEFQAEYGLIGGGAVNSSFIGRLPGIARGLGPVAAVSYRVASRIANTLRAGRAARSAAELNTVRLILFHSSPVQHDSLIEILKSSQIDWAGKSLLFCDSGTRGANHFREAGASVTAIRGCAIPGRMVVHGSNPSLAAAQRMVRELRMKPVEIDSESVSSFEAAVTLGSGALTPLLEHSAALFRNCGLRDSEAMRMSAALFERTCREYAHSGRQSWTWYSREPDVESLARQFQDMRPDLKCVVARLILSGLSDSGRHPEVVSFLREALEE